MDHSYWQNRYEEGAVGWDVGSVSEPLKQYIDQLTDTTLRILIPGCGFGHEAIYLEQKGFSDVTVIDWADSALEYVRAHTHNVNCVRGDFFKMEGVFDRILEQTLFCAIVPENRADYIRKVADLLTQGGKYAGVLFNRSFEGGPPFGGNVEEYERYFQPYFRHFSMDPCYNSIEPRKNTEVFVIAQK